MAWSHDPDKADSDEKRNREMFARLRSSLSFVKLRRETWRTRGEGAVGEPWRAIGREGRGEGETCADDAGVQSVGVSL